MKSVVAALSLAVAVAVASPGAPGWAADLKTPLPAPGLATPPVPARCVDLVVESVGITLSSTQAGDPAVEFPYDTVVLRAVLKNIGLLPVPPESNVRVFAKRNRDQVVYDREHFGIIGGAGSTWTLTVVDSFPHAVPQTYTVGVFPIVAECSARNNETSLPVDEAKLHAARPPKPLPAPRR